MLQSILIAILIMFLIIAIKIVIAMKSVNSQDFNTKEINLKKLIETGRNNNQVAVAYINLITLYINNKNYIEARKYLDLAKENVKSNNKQINLVMKVNESTLLIYENKYVEAEQLINELLPQCSGILNNQIKKALLMNMEEIRKQTNN